MSAAGASGPGARTGRPRSRPLPGSIPPPVGRASAAAQQVPPALPAPAAPPARSPAPRALPSESAVTPESGPETLAPGPAEDRGPVPGRPLRRAAWGAALGLVVVATALTHLLGGQTQLVISAPLTLLVAEAGLLLLGLAGLVVALRRWVDRARRRSREQTRREAWFQHQQFLRRLDHELKNPLTAVRAAVADLPQASRAERTSRLEVVDAQARRMGRLITDLRKLAELETVPLALEDVDLAETVGDAAEAVGEELAAVGNHTLIRLDLPQVPWPLPHVRGDGDLLYSAIYNVLSNAAKYTPPGGSIEVRGREEAGMVTVEVADTGIGVPPTDLPVVWSELGRAGNAHGLPGSGLGLPLVATIVRRHGGRARMASREGVGTRVWLSLPVAGPRQDGDEEATSRR